MASRGSFVDDSVAVSQQWVVDAASPAPVSQRILYYPSQPGVIRSHKSPCTGHLHTSHFYTNRICTCESPRCCLSAAPGELLSPVPSLGSSTLVSGSPVASQQ